MSSSIVLVDNQTSRRHNIALSTNVEDSSLTYVFTTHGNDSVGVSSSYDQDNVKHVARICNYYNSVLRLQALSDGITLAAATVHQRSAHREESQYFHCLSLRKSSPSHTETAHLRVGDTINFGDNSSVTLAVGEDSVEDCASDNDDGSSSDAEGSSRAVDLQSMCETPQLEEQLLGGGRIRTSTTEIDTIVANPRGSPVVNSPRPNKPTPEATGEQLGPSLDCTLQSDEMSPDASLSCSPTSQTNRTSHMAENRPESPNHTESQIAAGKNLLIAAIEFRRLPSDKRDLRASDKVRHNSDTDETESESDFKAKISDAKSEAANGNSSRGLAAGSDAEMGELTSAKTTSASKRNIRSSRHPAQRALQRELLTQQSTLHVPLVLPKRESQALGASTIPTTRAATRFLTSKGAKQIENIKDPETNFLCIGNGELKKTGKLILSIAKCFRIVTDQWVLDSMNARCLLEPSLYVPKDPIREEQWGFKLAEALNSDCLRLFQGHRICFTPALKEDYGNGFDELSYILYQTGAKDVFSKKAQALQRESKSNVILLALEHGDADAVLMQDAGWTCYRKDIVSLSILRCRLDLASNEFKFIPVADLDEKTRKKRKTV